MQHLTCLENDAAVGVKDAAAVAAAVAAAAAVAVAAAVSAVAAEQRRDIFRYSRT